MKMRVDGAKAVLSHETACAIEYGIQLNPTDKHGNRLCTSAALAAVDSRGSKNFSAVLPGFDSRQES